MLKSFKMCKVKMEAEIREKIRKLEGALIEGKITEETYKELKAKYEAQLARLGEVSKPSKVSEAGPEKIISGDTEAAFKKGLELVNNYLGRIDPNFPLLKLKPGENSSSSLIQHAGAKLLVIVGVEEGFITVTLAAHVCNEPKNVRDKDLAGFYRRLLFLNAANVTLTGTIHFGLVEGLGIFLMWSRPIRDLDFTEFKEALDLLSGKTLLFFILLRKEFSFIG
ncbi:MAG: hypothetical protein DRN90_01695 [Thermoproteota archaeon]|nr:MAG: hypothetical protein DRN90_01695 [Candidatus Korarchaeota archaeon]